MIASDTTAVPSFHGVIRQTTPCSIEESVRTLSPNCNGSATELRPIRRASRVHHDNRWQLASDLRRAV